MSRILKILMIVAAVVGAAIAALSMHGCATTSAITKACKPSTTDETQAVTTLWNDLSRTTAETVAILEGGKIGYCVISAIAQDVLLQESMATPKLATTLFALPLEPSLQASRAQAWIAKHP